MALPNIAPGTWFEIPNTKFSTFANANGIPAFLSRGGNGRGSIFRGWTSMGYDPIRKLWFSIRAGGHGDWAGNGAYAFHVDNLVWSVRRAHDIGAFAIHGAGYPPIDENNTNQMYDPGPIRIVSNVATDARLVTIEGLRASDEAPIQEILQLNGTTPVVTTNTFVWLTRITMSAPNSVAGGVMTVRNNITNGGLWVPTGGNTDSSKTAFQGPFAPSDLITTRGSTAYYDDIPFVASTTKPASAHTYDTIFYSKSTDRWASYGGIFHSPGGFNVPPTMWLFNPNNNQYHLPTVGSLHRPGFAACCIVWDDTLNCAWVRTSSALYQHDPVNNTFTQRHSGGGLSQGTMVINNAGRELYTVMSTGPTSISLQKYNISNVAAVTRTDVPITGNIDIRATTNVSRCEGPGTAYIGGRLAVYARRLDGRGLMHSLDTDTGVLVAHDVSGNGCPPVLPGPGGMFKQLMTPDGLHLYTILGQDENVWVYRPPWGGAQPLRPIGVSATVAA